MANLTHKGAEGSCLRSGCLSLLAITAAAYTASTVISAVKYMYDRKTNFPGLFEEKQKSSPTTHPLQVPASNDKDLLNSLQFPKAKQ